MNYAATASSAGVIAAAVFTALSLKYLKKTGIYIGDQTKASMKQADLTADLLKVELARDKQSNMISAYLIAEIEEQVIANNALGSKPGLGVKVTAIIDNQSLQPVFEIVAKLFKRDPRIMGKITLTAEDIPVSVVGPKTSRPTDITDYFVRDLTEINKTVFVDLGLAQHLAKQIEIEYLVLLNFRDSDGVYWGRNATTGKLEIIEPSEGNAIYQNALSASIDKLQNQFTWPRNGN